MILRAFTGFVCSILATCGAAFGQFNEDFGKSFEANLLKSMDRARTPGLAIAIVHDGNEVYSKAFGVRDIETKKPLQTVDLFHWASVTKPFVATAAMQLVEQGKLNLDTPVVEYLPYFKLDDPEYASITSRQLLTHTAGMPDVTDYEWNNPQFDDKALERWVRSLSDRKLLFPPGTNQRYSNIGFEVMGDVIAKASGMTIEEFVAQHIFQPLNMTSATLLFEESKVEDRVTPHSAERRDPIALDYWPYNRRHAPSSNLIASVHDLGKWAIVNLNHGELSGNRILSENAYEQLWKPTVEIAPNHGLSWSLVPYDGFDTVQHLGGDDGFRTGLILIPEFNLGIAIATNTDRAPVASFMKVIMDSVLDAVR